jgi:hypothetical protein
MSNCRNFLQSPFFFIVSSLQAADDHDTESNRIDCHRSTAGTVVQSLHKLKDVDGSGKKKKNINTAARRSSLLSHAKMLI